MGFKCGNRRSAKCRQIHPVQRADETQAAQAANYPFCTIEPNIGNVAGADARMTRLQKIAAAREDHPDTARLR